MRNTRGFTLIELLVVIAIIGILSSVVLASLNSARAKSRDARRLSDLKQFQLALELFQSANSSYPTTAQGLAILATNGHIPTIASDPQGNAYIYHGITGSGVGTNCTTIGTCSSYVIRAANMETAITNPITGTIPAGGTNCSAAGSYCIRP